MGAVEEYVSKITKRKDRMNTMKEPRGILALRTALISALALSVISATALFLGASAAEPAPDSVEPGIAFSEGDDLVQEPEEAEVPSEEGEEAQTPEASLTPQEDAGETGETDAEQTVTDEVSNELDQVVPHVVTRRVLTSSVYFATNYDTSFGGEIETELAKEFYDRLVEEYVTNASDATRFAFTPTKIDGKVEVTDPDEAKLMWDGATVQAKEAEVQSALSEAFSSATAAFWNDYPEAYWVGELGYFYTPSGSTSSLGGEIISFSVDVLSEFTITMKMKYDSARMEQDELTTYDSGVNEAVAAVNEKLTASSSRYDIVKAIHDYICGNASYDGPALTTGDPKAHTVAPFFIDKKKTETFVCEGYAKTFKILCGKYDIPCVLVSGQAVSGDKNEAHMWNYVQMDDNKWYAVDVTWDDQEGTTYYDYFLCGKTSKVFNNNLFMDDHLASGKLSTSGSAQEFVYPDLNQVAYDPNNSQTNPTSSTSTTASTTSTTAVPAGIKLTVESNDFVKEAEISNGATLSDADGNPVVVNEAKIVVSVISGSAKTSLFEKIADFDRSFDKDSQNAVAYDVSLVDQQGHVLKIAGGKVRFCLNYLRTDANVKNVKYTLYHQSGNSIEKKSIVCKSDGIWSETDGFSPYALAQSTGTDSPGTGENGWPIVVAVCLGVLALAAIVCVVIRNRKNAGK